MKVEPAPEPGLARARRLAFAALFAALAFTAALAPGLTRLRFDVSNQSLFVSDDPAVKQYDELKATFGSDEVMYVLLEVPDAFAEPHLGNLLALGERIRHLDVVEDLRSPFHSPVPRDQDGEVVSRSLAEERPQDDAARAVWRARILAYRPFRDLLISPDGKTVGFLVRLDPTLLTHAARERIVNAFDALLGAEPYASYPHSAVGTAVNPVRFTRVLTREVGRTLGVCLAVGGGLLLLLFGSVRLVLGPALVVVCTVVCTLGFEGWRGVPLTTLTPILVTLLVCVGVADAMHAVATCERIRAGGAPPLAALRQTGREVWAPCLLTTLTTAAGFLSLLVSKIAPIADMGLLAAEGALLAFVLTFALLPAFLLFGRAAAPEADPGPTARVLARLQGIATRRPGLVVLLAALGTAVCAAGIPRLVVDQNLLEDLGPEERLRQDLEFVHQRMGGSMAAEVVLQPLHPHDEDELAELLRRAESFSRWLKDVHPAVRAVMSAVDGLEEMHALFDGPREVPNDTAAVMQLILMLQSADAEFSESYLALDGTARITLRFDLIGSREYKTVLATIDDELARRFEGVARGHVTGGAMLLSRTNDYVLETQGQSFGLALLTVSVLVMLVARDLRVALLSLVPNLGPVVCLLGLMGWLGVSIKVGNVLIAAIVLGIVVDDTIHFVHRYQHEARSAPPTVAVGRTLQAAGRAILFTTLVLVASFFSYVLSELRSIREFGFLAAATFAVAFLADLIVMPALLCLGRAGEVAPPPPAGPLTGEPPAGESAPPAP